MIMGAINTIMHATISAIDDVGRKEDFFNDGYHFKSDPKTRSVEDITIKADGDEFVLACIWKNLKDYKPQLPNLRMALGNCGLVVQDKEELRSLISDLMYYIPLNSNTETVLKSAEEFFDNL